MTDEAQYRLHLERVALALGEAVDACQTTTGSAAPDHWARAFNDAVAFLKTGSPLLPEGFEPAEPLPPLDHLPGLVAQRGPRPTAGDTFYVCRRVDRVALAEVWPQGRDIPPTEEALAEAEALARLFARSPDLLRAAYALLRRVDTITTLDFSRGGERAEREALRAVVADVLGKPAEEVY